jgi:glycosyltransferase involved in cell wall biosynthesis
LFKQKQDNAVNHTTLFDKTAMKIAVIENSTLASYTIRARLMQALRDAGHEVYILTGADEHFAELEAAGYRPVDVGRSTQDPRDILRHLIKLRRALKQVKPQVCLTFTIRPAMYGNIIAGRLMRLPVLTNITGVGPLFESNRMAYRIARILYKFVLKKTHRIFFQNYDDMNAFLEHKYVTRERCVRVPGSGVEYEKYAPREKDIAPDGKFRFLFISRLIRDKGIGEYVAAARILREKNSNIICQVLGPLWRQNLKTNLISEEELQSWQDNGAIEYLGETKDVRPFIANADCIVLPSYREGTSNVLLEASSMARPVVSTNTTGCREIVEPGVTGFLCEVKDAQGLAEQMYKVFALDEAARKEMGIKGREKVIREYDKRIVINAYLSEIAKIGEAGGR